jgi:predicted kinase
VEVLVMSGLPGAGKDHWLRSHRPELPVISLDAIRRQLGVRPGRPQGAVVHRARDMARAHLRQGQPFAWNATNLTQRTRARTLGLLADYQARIRLVCVDPPSGVLLRQNRRREAVVPPSVIRKMARFWEFPDLTEAHEIDWITDPASPPEA